MGVYYGAPPKFERAECIKTAYEMQSYTPDYAVVGTEGWNLPRSRSLGSWWSEAHNRCRIANKIVVLIKNTSIF